MATYKVYTAKLTQSGTNAPVATIFENTLSGTPVWTRTGTGSYNMTLTGEFLAAKTFIPVVILSLLNRDEFPDFIFYDIFVEDDNIITINTSKFIINDGTSTPTDSLMNNYPFEVRVYL